MIAEVYNRFIDNDLITAANALSFKLILSVFPLLIFLISLVGFFNISYEDVLNLLVRQLPNEMIEPIMNFLDDIVGQRRISLLSTSLFLTLFSASSGFYYLSNGIRKAFDEKITKPIRNRAESVIIVVIFGIATVLAMYCYVFNDIIVEALIRYTAITEIPWYLSSIVPLIVSVSILIVFFIVVNNMAVSHRLRIKRLIPGILFTIVAWIVVSLAFKLYINNFSKYSVIYGSIGALFVFALWVNLLSFVLLIGAQINAVICDERFMAELYRDKGDK